MISGSREAELSGMDTESQPNKPKPFMCSVSALWLPAQPSAQVLFQHHLSWPCGRRTPGAVQGGWPGLDRGALPWLS